MPFGFKLSRTRRRVLIGAGLLIVIVGLAITIRQVAAIAGAGGDSALERWVAGQVKAIAGSYLQPELKFTEFDYQAPRTVTFSDVELIDRVNGEHVFVEARRLTLELAQVPRQGKPIVIEHIRLDQPVVRIATDAQTGELIGFGRMFKDDAAPSAEQTERTEPTEQAEPVKLNDVFRVRLIQIAGGVLEFVDAAGGRPMRLDDIDTKLTIGDPEDGWYAISMAAGRAPITRLTVDGRLNVDGAAVDLSAAQLELDLARENLDVLPASARALIEQYGLRGRLNVGLSGSVALDNPKATKLELNASVQDAFADFGEYVLPLKSLTMTVSVADEMIQLKQLSAELLGGRVVAQGSAPLAAPNQARLSVSIDDVRLEQAIDPEGMSVGAPPEFAGRITTKIDVDGTVAPVDSAAIGKGTLKIDDAWLINIPMISGLSRETLKDSHHQHPHHETHDGLPPHGHGRWHKHTGGDIEQMKIVKMTDAADITFDIEPDQLRFTQIMVTSPNIGVRGKGTLDFAGELNLRLRGGVLEKSNLFGDLSPIHYHVTGPVADPSVSPAVGSINRGLEKDEQNATPPTPTTQPEPQPGSDLTEPLQDGVETIINGVDSVIPDELKPE